MERKFEEMTFDGHYSLVKWLNENQPKEVVSISFEYYPGLFYRKDGRWVLIYVK